MIRFLGEYESTVDAKGRFLLPAAFRKQLPKEDGEDFVINRGIEKCLTIYPSKVWKPVFEEISGLDDFDPDVRKFRRVFLNGATPVEPDSAGRLLLPKHLMEYAGLDREIILVSAVNKIEVWDKAVYQSAVASVSDTEYSHLAAKVMSKKKEGNKDNG